MIRTFIAFEVDDRHKRECDYLILKGKKLFPKEIKWVEYENLHITFLFLGDIEQSDVSIVKDKLQMLSEKLPVLSLRNGQLRWNPSFKPKTLWIEYTIEDLEFGAMRKEFIDDLKEELPYLKIDDKDYKCHLTLGRVKGKINIEKWLLHEESFNHAMNLNHVSLYQSTLHPQGPVYRNLALITLNGGK